MEVQSKDSKIISLFVKDGDFPELRHYKRHEQIIVQGANARSVFLVKSGLVKIVKNHEQMDSMIVNFSFPNSLIGWSAVLANKQYQITATAMQETSGWMIDSKTIKSYFTNLGLNNQIVSELLKDSVVLCERIGSMAPRSGQKRFLSVLIMLADVYGISDDGELKLKLTIKDLAEIVLLSRETIHRIIRDVKADSIISIKDKKVICLDFEKLIRMSEN